MRYFHGCFTLVCFTGGLEVFSFLFFLVDSLRTADVGADDAASADLLGAGDASALLGSGDDISFEDFGGGDFGCSSSFWRVPFLSFPDDLCSFAFGTWGLWFF